jgi:dTDP-4-amino-4,6-dideoxygalactose transaminase
MSAENKQHQVMFSPPLIGEEEINEVVSTLRSNWLTTGPKTREFETEFAEYLGAPAAMAVNSCTAALHTALVALGVGAGDEVITTPITFAATANVIEHVGATPILVDVMPDTLNLDPMRVREAVTTKTKVILPVHYAGHPVELDTLQRIANDNGLTIVEDAAHAIPASYKGHQIGSSSNPTAFSFYATKNMTTGEGGMLTGTPEFLESARKIILHGLSREAWKRYEKGGSWRYDVVFPGFKYNMTDVQASLGRWQLRKLAAFQERRQTIVARYLAAFGDMPELEMPTHLPEVDHAWHLFVLRLNLAQLNVDRNAFIGELAERGVSASVHFTPIHLFTYYKQKYGFEESQFPHAVQQFNRMLSLPLSPALTDMDVQHVINSVQAIVADSVTRRMAA